MPSNNAEISDILTTLLKKELLTESELARKINIPRATINRLVSGRTPDPRASTLNSIAEYFKVSVDQLLGKKPLFSDVNQSMAAAQNTSIPIIKLEDSIHWVEILKNIKLNNHQDWITINQLEDKCEDEDGEFAVRISGESMLPQFQANTILIISPSKKAKSRDFVIAHVNKNNEVLFRQYIVENRYKFLQAINSMFPTIEMEDSDKILGVVIQIRKTYG